jgi:hypothetical protein
MYPRGVIRNRERAQQLRDFSGLRYGSITPTDIDGFMEFGDRVFIFIESKHAGAPLPKGQRMAIERLTDAISETGRASIAIVCEHNTHDDIDFANCPVREWRVGRQWVKPDKQYTLRAVIDSFLRRNGIATER